MRLFPFRKPKRFFSAEEQESIVEAVRNAEHRTSGEVRIFVESRCKFMDAVDRAIEIFQQLKMDQTKDRNAVLIYLAIKDRQLAILGDEGIHKRVGQEYWNQKVKQMISGFNKQDQVKAIIHCVKEIGEALHENFPYDSTTDKNELPDDMVFGK